MAMNILIATGIFPPDVGGPAQYAKNFAEEFVRQGHKVKVAAYKFEKKLPTGARHIFYFLKIFPHVLRADLIIALDTFSAGLPAAVAAKILGKKIITRVGGDFFWENYVDRTGNLITLKGFYDKMPLLSVKEKIIFWLTNFFFRNCSAIVFSTEWQRNIFEKPYNLNNKKIYVIENFFGGKIPNLSFKEKNFIWAGRENKLKNLKNLRMAFTEAKRENQKIDLEIIVKISRDELFKRMQNCYAIILPSVSDVGPNFILEGIAANKPFILTKETGFYDKLKDIGVFVDPMDIEDIKNKILFLADEKNYEEYKERVGKFNFTHSWQQIANEFLSVYKNL